MTNRERSRGGELQGTMDERVEHAIASYRAPHASREEKDKHRAILMELRKEIVRTRSVMEEIEMKQPGKSPSRTQEIERLSAVVEKISHALRTS